MPFRFERHLGPSLLAVAALSGCASASVQSASTAADGSTTSAAITAADLRSRLYAYADDSMMGRKAGTEGNNRATAYIAEQLRKLGVQPGGENGTYFQAVPLLHLTMSRTKPIVVDGRQFMPTRDYIARSPKSFNGAPAIYGGMFGDAGAIAPEAAVGKVVVLSVPNGPDGKPRWSGTRQPATGRYRNAVGIAIVGMDGMAPGDWIPLMEESTDVLDDPTQPIDINGLFGPLPGFMYVTKAMGEAMMGGPLAGLAPGTAGRPIGGGMGFDSTRVTARNVIGIIPGSDARLRGQYVAVGAHNDHVGFTSAAVDHDSLKAFNTVALPEGADMPAPLEMTPERAAAFRRILDSLRKLNPPRRDSIFNGADDDASGTVAVLEIAEAIQRSPTRPRRSTIFVWHTAEELGLYGSQYFTDHPTIPRDSIVAQLNMDMVGRGGAGNTVGKTREGAVIKGSPDYLQLVGSRRLSTELGDLVETVNAAQRQPLKLDYSIDANGHQANIYCRSDHYNYARYGIPITFFTTGGHSDYHQLTDEPQYIEYDHLTRVASFVHAIVERVANLDHRIVVDKPKPDPHGRCVQ
jgi:hypothetical protein